MSELIQIERFRKNGLKFIPSSNNTDAQLPIELLSLYEKYEKDGFRFFALDLINVSHLFDELIVLILELTARLRRRGGDLYIYNLHYDVLEDLLTFNPKKYLAIAENNTLLPRTERSQVSVGDSKESMPLKNLVGKPPLEKSINRMEIPYNEDDVYKACDFVTSRAMEMGFAENELSRIKIAVYEACLNAIQHTRKMNPGDKVTIEVETTATTLQINIYDRGAGFDPDQENEYDVSKAASHRKTGGMGLHIIRRAMDEVDYKVDRLNGNKLIMIKHLKH